MEMKGLNTPYLTLLTGETMKYLKLLTLGFLLLSLFSSSASALDIPESLEPWKPWVLHDKEDQACPPHFNDGAMRRCWWPAQLDFNADGRGAVFEMQARVYAPAWVVLPGGGAHWPASVFSEDRPLSVVDRDGRPVVRLGPGSHRIQGAMVWDVLPETLPVPPDVGLVSLIINGKTIFQPDRDGPGLLRLRGRSDTPPKAGTLTKTVFRLIEDDIPMRVITRVLLQVSGPDREIRLAAPLPAGGTVMKIDSPLPVRLAENEDLLVQVRPGRWDLRMTVRMAGSVNRLETGKGDHGPEIWSFKAFNDLRMVNVSGAPTVEPSRTQMPEAWKGLPAYRLKPGAALSFETIRRGDPDPAPDQLELQRTWWLDFDGSGFTLHDQISGEMNRTWHLAMNAPVELGRVAVNGKDQLITRQGDRPGVQLRHGRLTLEADSRMTRTAAALPAVGWDHDFKRASGVLNLPPGWALFFAGGVDLPPDAWLQRWTLLDLFLVLIIAISAWKIRSPITGLLVLVTLGLIFHEPGAPRYVWLHLLIAAALLKYLPGGWFRKVVRLWGAGAVIALVVIALPFMVQQIRTAVYPQLDTDGSRVGHRMQRLPLSSALQEEREAALKSSRKGRKAITTMQQSADAVSGLAASKTPGRSMTTRDPSEAIQTGPGLPNWRWRSVPLRWNGPVDRGQQLQLWLISPFMNLMIGAAQVVLLFALIVIVLEPRRWIKRLPLPRAGSAAGLLLCCLVLLPATVSRAESSNNAYPPQPLLDELQRRLLQPPECLPHCAAVNRLEVAATPDQIRLILQVHTLAETAIPLPAGKGSWTPARIVLNNQSASSIARDPRGMLWMVVPKGIHQLKLTGPPGEGDEVRIALPLRPHEASYAGVGWTAQGIQVDGTVDAGIVLTRIREKVSGRQQKAKAEIAPFFQISRTLHLGMQWEAVTRIRRQTPPGTPVVLSIPLLQGAAVTTAGIEVKEGFAQVVFGSEEVEAQFASVLPITKSIALSAPRDVPWTEAWTLAADAQWRCLSSGLNPVHHQSPDRSWQPQWRPWPGERLTLAVDRPPAVPGQTVTVDSARLQMTPGQRFTRSTLDFTLRSSRGGQHQVELPERANLQSVGIDGKKLPIRQDGRLVNIPLEPGRQAVQIQWQQLTDSLVHIQGPRVDMGQEAVNAKITFHMPDQRWILFAGGPTLGPAVLFWSYVIVVILAALGLGRTDITSLRTHHWLLLGLGLTQVPAPVAVLVVGWLLALGYRCRRTMPDNELFFNFVQLILVVLTLAALTGLYSAIARGLLGIPDMQIAGNQSTRLQLNWTRDRIDGILPIPRVLSLPLWAYRLLMLAWSLWLAFSLVAWLRWGWGCFSKDRLWKPIRRRRKKSAAVPKPDALSAIGKTAPGD
jgi:hypothetical protein